MSKNYFISNYNSGWTFLSHMPKKIPSVSKLKSTGSAIGKDKSNV